MTPASDDIVSFLSTLPVLGVGANGRFGVQPDPLALAEAPGGPSFIEYTSSVDHLLCGDALERLEELKKPALYRPNGLNLCGPHANPVPWVAAVGEHALVAESPWVSQGVGVCYVGSTPGYDVHLGSMIPPVFTRASLDEAVERVNEVRRTLRSPLLLEPPAVTFVAGDVDAFAWLGELATRTGCGLLLDAGNVVSHQLVANRSLSEGVDLLPLERVVALRVGGGLIEEHRGRRYYGNASDLPVLPEAWSVVEYLLQHCPNIKAVVVSTEGAVAAGVLPLLRKTRQLVARSTVDANLRAKARSELAS